MKEFIKRILSLLMVFVILVTFNGSISILADTESSNEAEEETEEYRTLESKILSEDKYCSMDDSDLDINLDIEKMYFLPEENIEVSFVTSDCSEIVSFTYETIGFAVKSIQIDEDYSDKINIELECLNNASEFFFELNVNTENDSAVGILYAVKNEYGLFISTYSEENAFERYLEYAVYQNIMTAEEAEAVWYGFVCVEDESDYIEEESPISTASLLPEKGTVKGDLSWQDDRGNKFPLMGVKVEIYKKTSLDINIRLGKTFTDRMGHYEISVPAANDIFICVSAADDNIRVGSGIFGWTYKIAYNNEDEMFDLESGDSISVPEKIIDMSTYAGQAMQISQAIMAGRDYAEIMMDRKPSGIAVIYPASKVTTPCYIPVLSCIALPEKGGRVEPVGYQTMIYSAWDTIMHEYGHHIECFLGIMLDPMVSHSSKDNHADKYGTEAGTRLAWGESWNTVFAYMAQKYLIDNDMLSSNINNIGDTIYTQAGYSIGYGRNIESLPLSISENGEACEAVVMAVLWDLYDSVNEEDDEISLGHEAYWELTTVLGTIRFSHVANRFYETYKDSPEMIAKFAKNL